MYEKDERGRSLFTKWSQMNHEYGRELIWLATKHPKAHGMLLFMVQHMDAQNAIICSYQVFQEVLGISKPTVARAVDVLKTAGFIAVFKSGGSNVYAVNDSIFWKSSANGKAYSKFPANVILTISEQDEFAKAKYEAFTAQKVPHMEKYEEGGDDLWIRTMDGRR